MSEKLTLRVQEPLNNLPDCAERVSVGFGLGHFRERLIGRVMKRAEADVLRSALERAEKCHNLFLGVENPEVAMRLVNEALEKVLQACVCNCPPSGDGVGRNHTYCNADLRPLVLGAIESLKPAAKEPVKAPKRSLIADSRDLDVLDARRSDVLLRTIGSFCPSPHEVIEIKGIAVAPASIRSRVVVCVREVIQAIQNEENWVNDIVVDHMETIPLS